MGDFEKGTENSESQIGDTTRNPLLFGAILSLIGLLAPVLISINHYGYSTNIGIQSMLWVYYSGSGFIPMDSFSLAGIFPFILLRFVPVLQLHRYYNGKTTRKRAVIASFVGDGYFLFIGLPIFIFSLLFASPYLMFPLPFQVIVAIFVLWRYPIPDPTTPWDSEEEPKSWWEKLPDSQQEKPTDDKEKLW